MTKKALKLLQIIFFVIGLVLLVGIVKKAGWQNILFQIKHLGWNLSVIVVVPFGWYLLQTLSWQMLLTGNDKKIPFWALFRSKVAGEAINTVTPANFLGGDFMRIYLLRRKSSVTALTASVVVDRTINSIAIIATIFMGGLAAFLTLPGVRGVTAVGISIFVITCSLLILLAIIKQKKGLFSSAIKWSQKYSFLSKWTDAWMDKAADIDEQIDVIYSKNAKCLWLCLLFHIISRLLGGVEIYWIGKAITPQFRLLVALYLTTITPIVTMIFTFIPGALGVMEGTFSAAMYLMGLSPALGITIQLIKRLRTALWLAVGFLFVSTFNRGQKNAYNKDLLQQPL